MTQPPDPAACSAHALWQETLIELRLQMTRTAFESWLADSQPLPAASTPAFLVIVVRNIYAWDWLTFRLAQVIGRAVVGVAGGEVAVCFIPEVIPRSTYERARRPPSRIPV